MDVKPTSLDGVLVVESRRHSDDRGYFTELWRQDAFADAGIGSGFVQNNRSMSKAGVLRGLHFQWPTGQGKLVRVDHGAVFDVAVDIRPDSASFGRWHGEVLSAENCRQLWIPPGFAHGFLTLSDQAMVGYLCTAYFAPADERAVAWNDPEIGIEWPLSGNAAPIVSPKDSATPSLAQWAAGAR